jgi:sulfate permease, SulP family
MDRLARSTFLDHLTGEVFLSQFQAMARLDPETIIRAARPAGSTARPDPKAA